MISGFLGSQQERAMSSFLGLLSLLWSKQMRRSELPALKADARQALAQLEAALPVVELGILRHQIIHIVDNIDQSGPPWVSAMWCYERLWGRVISWAKQPTHPATSLMLAYATFRSAATRYATVNHTLVMSMLVEKHAALKSLCNGAAGHSCTDMLSHQPTLRSS